MNPDDPKNRIGSLYGRLMKHPATQSLATQHRTMFGKMNARIDRHPRLKAITDSVPLGPLIVIFLAVIAIIVILLMHNASVRRHDEIYLDAQRISNLQQIRLDIVQYATAKGALPEALHNLVSENYNPNYMRDDYFNDPGTHQHMEYHVKSPTEYSLCAVFGNSSAEVNKALPFSSVDAQVWDHGPGYHCFDFNISVPPK